MLMITFTSRPNQWEPKAQENSNVDRNSLTSDARQNGITEEYFFSAHFFLLFLCVFRLFGEVIDSMVTTNQFSLFSAKLNTK